MKSHLYKGLDLLVKIKALQARWPKQAGDQPMWRIADLRRDSVNRYKGILTVFRRKIDDIINAINIVGAHPCPGVAMLQQFETKLDLLSASRKTIKRTTGNVSPNNIDFKLI